MCHLLAANDFHEAMEAVANSRSKSWYPHMFCDVFIQQVVDSGNPAPYSTAVIEYRGSKITRNIAHPYLLEGGGPLAPTRARSARRAS